uniref:C-type lectin domain-containing protein n=1 Tax=Anabas testudineus TaxID=64144 RepID=A0A3Q1HES0_ANATE
YTELYRNTTTSPSPLNVQQVKLPTEGQRSQQREWPCWFSVLCWQLLLLLFTVSVSFYTFIHVLSSKPSSSGVYIKSIITMIHLYHRRLSVFIINNFNDCEEDWELHGEKCYYFSTRESTWNQSRDDCRRGGGDLVKIDSREEQSFLVRKLKQNMNDDHDTFWIGLTDSKEEGKWLWVDDSPLNTSFLFWNDSEPNNWAGINEENLPEGEDCVLMGKKSGADDLKCWIDVACKILFSKSICEKPAETGRVTRV